MSQPPTPENGKYLVELFLMKLHMMYGSPMKRNQGPSVCTVQAENNGMIFYSYSCQDSVVCKTTGYGLND
jgi:hypothetical protein